ncbi:hypothetical protein GCM10011344_13280 [Dokdonia pacifica]|uniref:Antitoxin component YwqK of the YwqJK toxin-antitoxin module n=1 Tax=Dokdonia pacifica TaxID=1627892 RepID=A0A238WBG5_9FLAO|nr:hypothetical protein [Dokdonia pacifica]GGG13982.1 hypothetical protein GCM10011344_13280 [Dokdonia pacifica]SNR43039.1 Antitoxin component YwqK of the YwqJK toxin-antitoxin module [Dokdonia pacifica]
MVKNYISFVCSLFIFLSVTAQEKISYESSTEILKKASELIDQEKVDDAIAALQKISPNDSLYNDFFVTISYYQIAQEKYKDAITTIDKGLQLEGYPNTRLGFYINKGICYENLESYDLAKEVYLKGLEEFPRNYELRNNLSIINQKLEEPQEAFNNLMLTMESSPLYENTMLNLGNMYRRQNKKAQALLLYNLYLLFAPDEENSFAVLKVANEMVSGSAKAEDKPFAITPDDDQFETLNLIIESELALQKDYKIPNAINIGFARQTHALLAQLKEEPFEGSSVLWSQKIIPFFNWINENDHFDALSYTTAYPIQNEDYKKIIAKKTDDIKDFLPIAYQKWVDLVSENNIKEVNGKKEAINFNYVDGILNGEGAAVDGDTPIGKWVYYDSSGRIIARGQFTDGERDGAWEWYHENGKLKEKGGYKKGLEQGLYNFYHDNGNQSLTVTFKDGKLDGTYTSYTSHGGPLEKRTYKNGEMNGIRQHFFEADQSLVKYEYAMKNGDYDGDFKEYYANGVLAQEMTFKNGIKQGVEKVYHPNGKLASEATFKDGEYEGPYKTYHPSGKLKSTGTYEKGINQGDWKSYFTNEVLSEEVAYTNGKLNGPFLSYDREGKLESSFLYRNGLIKEYTYYAKDGTIIESQKKKSGDLNYKGFMADGTLITEGLYDVKGGKMGLWSYYDRYGSITDQTSYTENLAQGESKVFYPNGNIKDLNTYTDDTVTGYGASYYSFGQIRAQGYYNEDGLKDGFWISYYPDGTLKSETYYHKGDYNGTQKYYAPNGQLESKNTYKFDTLLTETYYGQDGKVLQKIDRFDPSLNEIVYYYESGDVQSKNAYSNGVLHGKYTSYDFYGKLYAEAMYVNDELQGTIKIYYPDGTIKSERNYDLGNLHGYYKTYFENGQVEDIYSYQNGELVGVSEEFNEAGIKVGEVPYIDNEIHGARKFYGKEKGTLQLIRFYDKGKLIGYSYLDKEGKELPMISLPNGTGKVISYYPNGKVARDMTYDKGYLQGEYIAYYENGNPERKHTNVDDEYNGTAYTYYPDGTLKSETQYSHGYKQGIEKKYHPNGNIKEEGNYRNDERSGDTHYYNEQGKKTKTEHYFNEEIVSSQTY